MIRKILLYINTIKFLKPEQLYLRIFYNLKIFYFKPNTNNLNIRSVKNSSQISFLPKGNSLKSKNHFIFLNKQKKFKQDVQWNKIINSKLWSYNLNYFDFINSVSNKRNTEISQDLLIDWIRKNNTKQNIGWDAYPTSLRIVNIIKWLLQSNITSNNFNLIVKSLYEHGDYLSKNIEYHLKGNHLIANAKALFFCGLFFEDKISKKWLDKSEEILINELKIQILDDGAHYELSPMYHSIIIEDLIDILELIRIYKYQNPILIKIIKTKVKKMIYWLEEIRHPNYEIPFFNDSTFGIAQNIKSLKKYASKFGLSKGLKSKKNLLILPSGYAVFNFENVFLICDVGNIGPDEQPGHAHADTLSFESSIDRYKFIVNSGVSTYEDSDLRHFQRSTAAHSTLEFNKINSSEVWKSFRVAKRANVKILNFKNSRYEKIIKALHDGYSKIIKSNMFHIRTITLKKKFLEIYDEINVNTGEVIVRYYLHPNIKYNGNNTFKLPSGKKIKMLNENKFKIKKTHWYPGFGKKESNYCIECYLKKDSSKVIFYWR